MEKEDEFLHTYFTHVSQLCYDRAKEHAEKEKGPKSSPTPWTTFMNHLQQLALAEKSYIEIGFLQTKLKSFLRKDNSLKSVYECMRGDLKKLEDNSSADKRIQNYCKNISEFVSARISLIELYEKIYNVGIAKQLNSYHEILANIEAIIQKHSDGFTDISLTPVRAVFNLECEILQQLFKASTELQRLQFLPSLALVYGAHTRLNAWETKMQSRESWTLGIVFKNSPLPALYQWLQKLRGAILSKFSLYFHDTLAQQTTPNDMRQLCSKLQFDHYQKMVAFQRKYDSACVILLSDNQVSCDTTDYDSFPIIVSYPPKYFFYATAYKQISNLLFWTPYNFFATPRIIDVFCPLDLMSLMREERSPPQLEMILKMISETAQELGVVDKIIYKFSSQELCTYVLTTVEPNIYLVILFENKKSEKDAFISNFVGELCQNLRCTKVLISLKNPNK